MLEIQRAFQALIRLFVFQSLGLEYLNQVSVPALLVEEKLCMSSS